LGNVADEEWHVDLLLHVVRTKYISQRNGGRLSVSDGLFPALSAARDIFVLTRPEHGRERFLGDREWHHLEQKESARRNGPDQSSASLGLWMSCLPIWMVQNGGRTLTWIGARSICWSLACLAEPIVLSDHDVSQHLDCNTVGYIVTKTKLLVLMLLLLLLLL
jgi:hypothetical protein